MFYIGLFAKKNSSNSDNFQIKNDAISLFHLGEKLISKSNRFFF